MIWRIAVGVIISTLYLYPVTSKMMNVCVCVCVFNFKLLIGGWGCIVLIENP